MITRLWNRPGALVLAAAAAAAVSVSGCRKKDAAPPVATPTVTINHDRAPLGGPIEITYKFVVAPDARFDQDYRVMVHVVDSDDEMMWTDDHNPPVPTSQWKPGQTIEYTHTIFVPVYPYVGEASIELGLYSIANQKRLPLAGEDTGQRAYRVARLQLLPQTENLPTVFTDGWNAAETANNNPAVEWQWTKKDATLSFKNPKKDSVFYLELDNPGGVFDQPQQVRVSIVGGAVLETFTLEPKHQILKKIPIPAAALGTADMAQLQIDVDKSFVPVQIAPTASRDTRELGVRVFHAFIDPR